MVLCDWHAIQGQGQHLGSLTNELNGLREELRKILAPVVRDGDLLVMEIPILLEEVRQVGGNIEDVADA